MSALSPMTPFVTHPHNGAGFESLIRACGPASVSLASQMCLSATAVNRLFIGIGVDLSPSDTAIR